MKTSYPIFKISSDSLKFRKNAETPLELSERIEEDYETVVAWLNGDFPTQEKLYKLKNYYHVSVAYLTDEH